MPKPTAPHPSEAFSQEQLDQLVSYINLYPNNGTRDFQSFIEARYGIDLSAPQVRKLRSYLYEHKLARLEHAQTLATEHLKQRILEEDPTTPILRAATTLMAQHIFDILATGIPDPKTGTSLKDLAAILKQINDTQKTAIEAALPPKAHHAHGEHEIRHLLGIAGERISSD